MYVGSIQYGKRTGGADISLDIILWLNCRKAVSDGTPYYSNPVFPSRSHFGIPADVIPLNVLTTNWETESDTIE